MTEKSKKYYDQIASEVMMRDYLDESAFDYEEIAEYYRLSEKRMYEAAKGYVESYEAAEIKE